MMASVSGQEAQLAVPLAPAQPTAYKLLFIKLEFCMNNDVNLDYAKSILGT